MEVRHLHEWLGQQCAKAADEWFRQQAQSHFAQLFLYYRRGELTVAEACPPGFTLASGVRLAPGDTKDEIQRQIYAIAVRLPCLPDVESHVAGRAGLGHRSQWFGNQRAIHSS